jgi:hypothetical protein
MDLFWQGPFVAGFASSNLGDVSPNILGPHCVNTGESCDNDKSTCPNGGVGSEEGHAYLLLGYSSITCEYVVSKYTLACWPLVSALF